MLKLLLKVVNLEIPHFLLPLGRKRTLLSRLLGKCGLKRTATHSSGGTRGLLILKGVMRMLMTLLNQCINDALVPKDIMSKGVIQP